MKTFIVLGNLFGRGKGHRLVLKARRPRNHDCIAKLTKQSLDIAHLLRHMRGHGARINDMLHSLHMLKYIILSAVFAVGATCQPFVDKPTQIKRFLHDHTSNSTIGGQGGQLDNNAIKTANKQGDGTKFAMAAGSFTPGNCRSTDAGGNDVDAGTPCSSFSIPTLGPLQFLQGAPDTTSPTLRAGDLTYYAAADYNFPTQTPGGTLSGTVVATITLTPCPLGVAGADANHYLRIAGGSGTAETVLITGGSCTSGASTGSVMFTPANNHGGAWTITSASGGIREAILASGGNARIVLSPNTTVSISGTNGLVIDKANLTIEGYGYGSKIQALANEGMNVPVNVTIADGLQLLNFSVDGNRSSNGTNPTFGAGIACGTAAVGGCSHVLMRGLEVFHSALFGIIINDSSTDIEISRCYIHDNGGVTNSSGNGTGIYVYWVAASPDTQTTNVRVLGNYISENHNTIVNANAGGAVAWYGSNVIVDGNYIINNYNGGGQVVAAGHTGPGTISNNTIIRTTTALVESTSGIEIQTPDQTVTGNTILTHETGWGIALEGDPTGPGGVGANNTVITGNFIYDTFMSIGLINAGGYVRATTITGNRIWTSSPAGSSTVGIGLDSASAATVITGNNFLDTPIPVQDNSTFGAYLANNYPQAANLIYGSTIASASTINMRCGMAAIISGATTIQTIALPSDSNGTNGSGCHVSLIAAGGATWATGTSGNISTALTSSAGTGIELVNTGGEWHPIGGSGGGSLPTVTPLQYLRGNEYTSVLEGAAFPIVVVADYNYAPQAPGGSVSIGSNTKTLTPCPLGLGGSDTNHGIYLSGGTGAAEAVLIAGGTCTSGAASGTIVFTAANTHTGGWQISSSSAGIEEAVNVLPSTGGTLLLPADNALTMRRQVDIALANVTLMGQGMDATILVRGFATSPSSTVKMTGQNDWVKNLTMNGNDLCPYPCTGEVELTGDYSGVDGIRVRNMDDAAVHIHGNHNVVRNSQLLGLANSSVNHGFMGIYVDLPDAVNDLLITGNIIKDMTLNGIFAVGGNITIVGNHFEGNHHQTSPTGGGQIDIKDDASGVNNLISGNTIGTGGNTATTGIESDCRNTTITGNTIYNQGAYGITISTGANTLVVGNTIDTTGNDGILVAADVVSFTIADNRVVNAGAHSLEILAGTGDKYIITNNDLRGNTSGLSNGATGNNRTISGNQPPADNGVTFANIGSPDNGTSFYCPDCTIANPCAGSGAGAIFKMLNGVKVCN